jgi:hypothetical protein
LTILTLEEAAVVLRTTVTDEEMFALLPLVDAYIKRATGRDWAADTTIAPEAKSAARILLVQWHEDPGQIGDGQGAIALAGALTQLEAFGRVLTFMGLNGGGYCSLPGAKVGDVVAGVVEIAPTPGDAHTLFESVITYCDLILQTSSGALGLKTYRVRLVSAAAP